MRSIRFHITNKKLNLKINHVLYDKYNEPRAELNGFQKTSLAFKCEEFRQDF